MHSTRERISRWAWTFLWAMLVVTWYCVTHTEKFCRRTGLCDCPGPVLVPSPRLEPWCVAFNKKLFKEVAKADAGQVKHLPLLVRRRGNSATRCPRLRALTSAHWAPLQGYDLLFYGDSITETWRGTDMGRPCSRCEGVPKVFSQYFGSKYKSEVLAVGGGSPPPRTLSSSSLLPFLMRGLC